MKPILFLKWMDIVLQFLVPYWVTAYFTEEYEASSALLGWVALGATQTISCFINILTLGKKYRHDSRRNYERVSLVVVCTALSAYLFDTASSPLNLITCVIFAIVSMSPGLAIWYWVMSIKEAIKLNTHHEDDIVL